MEITVHKTKAAIKPISVNGVQTYHGVLVGKEFSIRNARGQQVATSKTVRGMEFALRDYLKAQA